MSYSTSLNMKINKKIPGLLLPPPKNEIDGKITDLSSKSIPELCELRDRQLKLLNNKQFTSKLADKGAKIQAFHDRLIQEIKSKQNEEETCHMFDCMKLNSINKEAIEQVEWVGKIYNKNNTYLDSDDDSEPEDVLHILSQNTIQDKQTKVETPNEPLITLEDLVKLDEIPHVKYIVEKTEVQPKPRQVGQFKPYRTTKSDVHDPKKELQRKKHKYWEVTAATPPPMVHGPAKILSLEESLTLQKEYNAHLRVIEATHAAEKLLTHTGIKMAKLPSDTTQFGTYREAGDSDDSDSSESEKIHDEIHDEEPGGVVYTVMK